MENGSPRPEPSFLIKVLELIQTALNRARFTIWLLVAATTYLAAIGVLEAAGVVKLFIIFVSCAVGGEMIVGSIIDVYLNKWKALPPPPTG